jgi:hypothetical protein
MQDLGYLLSITFLTLSVVTAVLIGCDLRRNKQHMAVMNPVWIISALYFGPFAWLAYVTMGRSQSYEMHHQHKKPFWKQVFVGTTHCGAGCTLGDIIAETLIFTGGVSITGSVLGAEMLGDFALAFLLSIAFQYFAIVPMRQFTPVQGLRAALKADALSLISFEVGLFAWMAMMRFVLFLPPLHPNNPIYWFMMQIGMMVGFATSYPVNWWLLKAGIKEGM